MSDRYKGAILSGTAPTVTLQSAGGEYTLSQQMQYQGQGVWPTAAQNPITQSLRFRASASAYLSRTPASATNRKTWTWSAWVKRGTQTEQMMFGCGVGGSDDATYTYISFGGTNADQLYVNGYTQTWRKTTQLFRDFSAWYHIVVAVDTTQATADNRIKMYVNGSQVTSFATANNPSQNSDLSVNRNAAHSISSRNPYGADSYVDGYMGEINFIDGVQLTPSSFGTTDVNGIWQPIPYTGSYGTNGFYLPFRVNNTSTYVGAFNGSNQYLNFTGNSSLQLSTGNFTIEAWVYGPTQAAYAGITGSSTVTSGWTFRLNNTGNLVLTNGTTTYTSSATVAINTWAHVAVTRNGTSLYFFINGNLAGTATSSDSIDLTSGTFQIARGFSVDGTSGYFSGSISNLRIVKGTAVYTANFTPSTTPLTAISGTSLLTLQNATIVDNSTNAFTITNNNTVTTSVSTAIFAQPTLTSDYSGNNNGWFANNISLTPGSTYDAMLDSPSNASSTIANYCTLNPLDCYDNPPTQGNLARIGVGHGGSPFSTCRGTFGVSSGKWYFEALNTGTVGSSGNNMIGVMTTTTSDLSDAYGGSTTSSYQDNGGLQGDNSTGTVVSSGNGDIIMIAFDVDTSKMWVGKNGTWMNSGNPVTGVGYVFSALPVSPLAPQVSMYGNTGDTKGWILNFGQQGFTYTPPTGFIALNTYNLPVPTIPAGNKQMDATIWTGVGTSSALTISSLNFQPDLVWGKPRSLAYSHSLSDSVRGVNKRLQSQATTEEQTNFTYGYTSSFNSNGFTATPGATDNENWNQTGETFVAWSWKAGNGVTSSNTNGSITSTVSTNPTAGFSVVAYTGTGAASNTVTIGHGLGVKPAFVITKKRSGGTDYGWSTWHQSLPAGYGIWLNQTSAQNAAMWNGYTNFSSTVFSPPDLLYGNESGATYINYCWAPVAGFSAFGSYTGNGSADGPFVYTGFRPKYLMIKSSTLGTSWWVFDSARSTYNVVNAELSPDQSSAEVSGDVPCDFVSNGIKFRSTWGGTNYSGATYIYMAFAENPFKIARGR